MEILKAEDMQCEGCGEYKPISLFRSIGRLCEDCKLVAFNLLKQPNKRMKPTAVSAEDQREILDHGYEPK